MEKKLKIMCWSIEINLFLWLMIFGCIWIGGRAKIPEDFLKTIVLIGLLFSAVLQHWAYYHLRKEIKK